MNLGDALEFLWRRRKFIAMLSLLALAALVVIGAIPALVDKHHAHTEAEHIPGFWAGSWAEVRKEMAGRYPKHAWPTDPANAANATDRTGAPNATIAAADRACS